MKTLYDLFIGDSNNLIGVLLTALLTALLVRLGQPVVAALVLVLGTLVTLISATVIKARRSR